MSDKKDGKGEEKKAERGSRVEDTQTRSAGRPDLRRDIRSHSRADEQYHRKAQLPGLTSKSLVSSNIRI